MNELITEYERLQTQYAIITEDINRIWQENNMFEGKSEEADKHEGLMQLNYDLAICTMKIHAIEHQIAQEVLKAKKEK